MINNKLLQHSAFWIFWVVAFLGAYEQALDAGVHPIFGNGFGVPFLHHYVWGMLGVIACYFGFTKQDWLLLSNKIRKAFIMEDGNIYYAKE